MAYKFLQQQDLQSHILTQFLNERNQENTAQILEQLELQNIEIIKSKIKDKYDVDAIFNAAANDRHYLIIRILTKLVLYDYVRRNASRKVPQDYVKEWEWAMHLLEKIKAGKETPDGLPTLKNAKGEEISGVRYGNNKNSDYYI